MTIKGLFANLIVTMLHLHTLHHPPTLNVVNIRAGSRVRPSDNDGDGVSGLTMQKDASAMHLGIIRWNVTLKRPPSCFLLLLSPRRLDLSEATDANTANYVQGCRGFASLVRRFTELHFCFVQSRSEALKRSASGKSVRQPFVHSGHWTYSVGISDTTVYWAGDQSKSP